MDLSSMSASSALVFEQCEARFKAERINHAPQPSGSPAAFGTACHTALQDFVEGGHWADQKGARTTMEALFTSAYWEEFATLERFEEGLNLVLKWLDRTDWSGRTVLSTELKESFDLPTSEGLLPVKYIWDRCDDLGHGEIDVVDYKTWFEPVKFADMKKKIQVRVYALAAAIKYKGASRIWITLDQLRYEPISCSFTREENLETWRYLQRLAERVYVADGTIESLNGDCRYCVRKHVCEEFRKHEVVGGALAITDHVAAARRRYELVGAQKAIDVMLADLDAVILGHCRTEDVFEYEAGPVNVSIGAKGARKIDAGAAARILGPALAAEFPDGIKMGVIDKLLKEKPCRLDSGQQQAIRHLIRKEFGDATVKVSAADPTGLLVTA